MLYWLCVCYKRINRGDNMTTENKKEVRNVVSFFVLIFLLVFGSIIVDFNLIDLIYLIVIVLVVIKYLLIKRNK